MHMRRAPGAANVPEELAQKWCIAQKSAAAAVSGGGLVQGEWFRKKNVDGSANMCLLDATDVVSPQHF